ncbi:hypothetical protein [Patulibacter minatonensis]|uniref:hypothetical protein n=1 Tax=Patulibacter minatonensis TaxID=298163 RepID=UPI0004786EDF|nr:hypothetical protein [Patulibacter minatonensis]
MTFAPSRLTAPARAGALLSLLALLVLVPGALLAVPASAAPYTVWSCQGPSGEPQPGTAWVAGATGPGASASSDCAGGMRAEVPAGQGNARAAGTLTFTAPPGTRITEYELARTLRATVGGLFASGYAASVSSVDAAGTLGPACSGGGPFASTCTVGDPAVPLTGTGTSFGGIVLSAGCAQDACPSATPSAQATLARSRVVLEDMQVPTSGSVGGTIKDDDRVARSVVVTGSDVGGGVQAITGNVDGGRSAVVQGGGTCQAPFVLAQPCPGSRSTTFGVDTGPLRRGDHVVSGTVVDAAGNTSAWGPVPFVVAKDGSRDPGPAPAGSVAIPVSSSDTPPGATARLSFQGATTKDGRRQPKGYLRTLGGAPLAGVTVRLSRTQTGAATPKTVTLPPVRSGRDGRFAAPTLPEGAWTVAGAADVSSGTVTGSIRLRTGLRISASPSPTRLRTGGLMVLSGRLRGAGPAKAGVRVRIQTIVKGRYVTVAAVRTTASGRWQWRHRFTKVTRPTLFSFRAQVPGEGDSWPWKPVVRRAESVLVNPR